MAVKSEPTANGHTRSILESSSLSRLYVADFIAPVDVIRVLNAAAVKYVLVGAHSIGGWTHEPRATKDVDVIASKRDVKKAVTALTAAFPHLECDDQSVVVRLRIRDTREVAIDVMRPIEPVIAAALKNSIPAAIGRHKFRVPGVEMALALKFAPMVSLYRPDDKKLIDAADFIRIVRRNADLDLEKLSALGELVYPGGGTEIREMVRRVRAGEKLLL